MNRLLVVLVLLVAAVVGLGFYQGWFHLSTDSTDHKSNVTLSVDQDKIQEDEKTAKEKLQTLGRNGKEAISDRSDTVKEQESRR
jgi:phosphatidate phosphatase APP1